MDVLRFVPIIVKVVQKLDVNGNSIFRCFTNRLNIKPKTIKSAYSRRDAAECFIKQVYPKGCTITAEAFGFSDVESLFMVETAKEE